jgi:hypothetical protein
MLMLSQQSHPPAEHDMVVAYVMMFEIMMMLMMMLMMFEMMMFEMVSSLNVGHTSQMQACTERVELGVEV